MTISIGATKFINRHALGFIRVYATQAGDVAYVDVTPLFRIGQINFGIQIQAHASAVTPAFTCAETELATVPANDTKVPWKVLTQIAASDIVMYAIGATVVRLTFAGAGEAYIGTM